ncbi:carbohydrate ABC transporter permease [Mycoplasma sp. CSL10137]|uniref:carbohydrate ABC transporter permease n=1 Tax=unclassified Mycoplasma TaxID=2683645 RepID=UPI00197C155C|nr:MULTISPECIES: carbohydrate ABC transporter permease [unclassified Mycoplasma]MBN4083231.1 carbohydrate ABC transporter permease [Mycoplasma sp. CSL10137]MBN4084473.1 carbohydrate ABC transporter permease [Mycoplasma sp. CSL10166]MBU4692952.1 carbohydrate ABC transporter permease [Mycoplasma sp. CSL7491-lung]
MFEWKLKLQKRLIKSKIKRNQEKVTSEVVDKNLSTVILSGLSKLLLLSFFGVLILFPFILMISISFMTDDEALKLQTEFRFLPSFTEGRTYFVNTNADTAGGFSIAPWATVVANTYKRAFTSGFWSSAGFTFLNVLISVTLKVIITFLMGYAFSLRNWKGKNIIWFFALALLVLPEVALLSGQYTVVVKTNLKSNLLTMLLGISLPFVASVFNTVMYKNAFEAIPGRIKEVSLVDGASGFKYLFKVAFPMVVPTTLTIVILTALASWNSYLWPSIIASDFKEAQVISVWLFKAGIDPNDPDSTQNVQQNIRLAASVIVILPMFIIYLIFRKRIMSAISRQGSTIKG